MNNKEQYENVLSQLVDKFKQDAESLTGEQVNVWVSVKAFGSRMSDILWLVSDTLHVAEGNIVGDSRQMNAIDARYITVCMVRHYCMDFNLSAPVIGAFFGKNKRWVYAVIKRVNELLDMRDARLTDKLQLCKEAFLNKAK